MILFNLLDEQISSLTIDNVAVRLRKY